MTTTNSTYTSTPELSAELRGPVLWLTITREERRNAMSHGVLAAMAQAMGAAQAAQPLSARLAFASVKIEA